VEVALALGVGDTERDKYANSLLRYVLSTDADRNVRDAAKLSLKGQITNGWVADEIIATASATSKKNGVELTVYSLG
jgi:hypothetical protein